MEDIHSISKMSLADDTAYGASVISQVAGVAALQQAGGWRDEFRAHVKSQCRRAVSFLNAVPYVSAVMPEGTFVVFANVSYYLRISGMDEEGESRKRRKGCVHYLRAVLASSNVLCKY